MSASFVRASSTGMTNAASPVNGYPCTVGFWLYPHSAADLHVTLFMSSTADNTHNLGVVCNAGVFRITAAAGGTSATADTASFAANTWNFVVGRFISATNRRIAAVLASGATTHAQSTTSRSPSGIDRMRFGGNFTGTNYLDGKGGELWYTATDIQPDGLQLQDSTLRQLAYGGPFSLPHIAKDIIEYRSFRSGLDSRVDAPGEVYHKGLRQTWTNTNGVTLGPHPPVASMNEGPLPDMAPMVIV